MSAKKPRIKGDYAQDTTHNRVLIETSERANELARRWSTTKIEVYRYLVDLAFEGKTDLPGE